MNIEQRIRKLALKKVKVGITKKKTNKGGYTVVIRTMGNTAYLTRPTYGQAVVELYKNLRISEPMEFTIQPKKPCQRKPRRY